MKINISVKIFKNSYGDIAAFRKHQQIMNIIIINLWKIFA